VEIKSDKLSAELLEQINKAVAELRLTNNVDPVIVQVNTAKGDASHKSLTLLEGDWSEGRRPWIVIDEHNKIHTMVSISSMMQLLHSFSNSAMENFNLRLEKAIWSRYPLDFFDVWAVATGEINHMIEEHQAETVLEIDTERLIEKIKLEHPNLFMHVVRADELPNDSQDVS